MAQVGLRQLGDLSSRDQAAAVQALLARHRSSTLARRRLGLERRRIEHAQRDVPLPRHLPGGRLRGPGAGPALYDTIYQERYMGLPDDNAAGYRLGSPITTPTV